METQKALNNLKDTRDCLIELGLNYFLIDGTLLGCIREGGFIEHDLDLDLGVYMSEWNIIAFNRFVDLMKLKGFILHHSFGIFGKHFEVAFKRDNIKIDLFFYYKHENKYRFNAFLNGGRNLPDDLLTYEYPLDLIDNLEEVEFLGEVFFKPENAEEVLRIKYGENWRLPDKNWSWAFSPKNRI